LVICLTVPRSEASNLVREGWDTDGEHLRRWMTLGALKDDDDDYYYYYYLFYFIFFTYKNNNCYYYYYYHHHYLRLDML